MIRWPHCGYLDANLLVKFFFMVNEFWYRYINSDPSECAGTNLIFVKGKKPYEMP